MRHLCGENRDQLTLFSTSLDDYIPENHPVRVIDAFIEGLDLAALGFARVASAATGRPPYHPGDLLKLYVYGYLHRVRSSRALEREAARNVELLWLLGRLVPDHKTIADFRRHNGPGIQGACRDFVLVCRKLSLLGGEWVAIDGSHFQAANSRARHFTRDKLKERLERLDARIAAYLAELDAADAEDAPEPAPEAEKIAAALALLRERRGEYGKLLEELTARGETQVALTDPEARLLSKGAGKTTVGYNVQLGVDAKHKLIATHAVTNNGLDRAHLSALATEAKKTLGVERLSLLGDKGYYEGAEIKACVDHGITPYIPRFATANSEQRGRYGKQHFRYEPATDSYRCPGEQVLERRYGLERRGKRYHVYETPACGTCALRARCTSRKKGPRRIERWEHEALLEAMERRVKADPTLRTRRASLAEHPFGTLKRAMGHGYFLLRGLEKVRTEMSLSVLAYNLKRVMTILGCHALQAALSG